MLDVSYIFIGFALTHMVLLAQSFKTLSEFNVRVLFLRVLLCTLTYDNIALALGNTANGTSWFTELTTMRFIFHATVLPFLTLFCLSTLGAVKAPIANNTLFRGFAFLFTAAALIYGVWHEVMQLELGVIESYGHYRMTNLSPNPPFATIATNILTIIMGAMLWRAKGPRWLFSGAFIIFLLNGALASQPWGFVSGNMAEVLFIVFLLRNEEAVQALKA